MLLLHRAPLPSSLNFHSKHPMKTHDPSVRSPQSSCTLSSPRHHSLITLLLASPASPQAATSTPANCSLLFGHSFLTSLCRYCTTSYAQYACSMLKVRLDNNSIDIHKASSNGRGKWITWTLSIKPFKAAQQHSTTCICALHFRNCTMHA